MHLFRTAGSSGGSVGLGGLGEHEITILFLSLGLLLAAARVCGEVARKLNQPTVLGELTAGILLGPTVLGAFWPDAVATLFPTSGPNALALQTLTTVAISLFLLVAGMEVDLSSIWRQGRSAIAVSVTGILIPFTVGFLVARYAPGLIGRHADADPLGYALFFAAAMSISALPVIAKTLMDLNLYRSDLGMVVIAAAVFDDLTGWITFALILGLVGGPLHEHALPVGWMVLLTLGFTAFALTLGRMGVDRALPWIQAHTAWPGGVLGFALSLGLLGAAFTQWIGIHAIFGSFLVGVAIGDSSHLREQTRTIIHQFVSFIFAPLFFASVGLKLNFAAHFDPRFTAVVLFIACVGKVAGCGMAARWSGMPRRESAAIGLAMNARGAMEIIFGLLGLQAGLIRERMFVTLVVVAMVTSMISGPGIRYVLRLRRARKLGDFLLSKAFLGDLSARTRDDAIGQLCGAVASAIGLDEREVVTAVLERERQGATGLGEGIAVPHARLPGLDRPVIGVGLSRGGVDFDAPDGDPAQIIFLVLTPREDDGAQVEILAEIARAFRSEGVRGKAIEVRSYTEFLALVRTQGAV